MTESTTSAIVVGTGTTITVRVPLRFARRGGRKVIVAPSGAVMDSIGIAASKPRVVGALAKALARAFRWREMIEAGASASVRDLAKAEEVNPSYVSRVLRLTLLAPDIVEGVLDGRREAEIMVGSLLSPFPYEWAAQREARWGREKSVRTRK